MITEFIAYRAVWTPNSVKICKTASCTINQSTFNGGSPTTRHPFKIRSCVRVPLSFCRTMTRKTWRGYSSINFTKSPASGEGDFSEHMLVPQIGWLRIFLNAEISVFCIQSIGGGSSKADSHIACRDHAFPLPCRATKGLECVFHIWFTQCGRVGFTLSMPCPCPALTRPFFSRPRNNTDVERRRVGYLPAFGFFRLPREVPRRLL